MSFCLWSSRDAALASSVDQIEALRTTNHSQAKDGCVRRGNMGELPMTTTEAPTRILHGRECLNNSRRALGCGFQACRETGGAENKVPFAILHDIFSQQA
ncbi:MAG: hypothetical protein Q9201_003242 [Fulgogasparrea decipioides]